MRAPLEVLPCYDVFKAGHVRKKADILKSAGDTQGGYAIWGKPMDRAAVEQQASGIRFRKAADHVYQRGLARTVRTYKPVNGSAFHAKRDIGQGIDPAKGPADLFKFEKHGLKPASPLKKELSPLGR